MKKPKDYLENCEYISQDGDTVYIDEEALETCMEDYAHQSNPSPPGFSDLLTHHPLASLTGTVA